jgi:hypothetical protein
MENIAFSRSARRPVSINSDPLLQWSTGLPTTDRSIYAGWLIESGRNDALDTAMQGAGFEQVSIKHGNGNVVTHWKVEQATMFVLADGVQTLKTVVANRSSSAGCCFGSCLRLATQLP